MKIIIKLLKMLACLAVGLLGSHVTPVWAGSSVWNGGNGTNLLWNVPGNWTPSGIPGTNDDALFFNLGTTNDNVSIDTTVSADITVHAFRLGETNGFHNVLINSGVTLTVAGTNDNGYGPLGVDPTAATITNGLSTMFAGPWPGVGIATAIQQTNTISGPGTLSLNNPNNELMVRYANGANVVHFSVLDLSRLNTFVARLARIGVGYGQPGNTIRAMGTLLLAATNTLTLTGTNLADINDLIVGDNTGNNDGNSTTAVLQLGQKNTINANQILVGGQKTPGSVLFNPNFASPSLVLRGGDGISRVSALRIGDESDAGASGSPTTGTFNLLAGTADILADTIVVGKGQNGSGNTTAATGTLSVGAGTLDVNTLQLGYQFNSAQGGVISGTANFSNATVVVNKLLGMGHSAGSAAARNATLNITGGSFTVASNFVVDGTATIRVTNSVLALATHPAVTANTLVLDGGAISNAATIKVTNSLTILDGGQILGGNPIFDMGNSGSANWNVTGTPTGNLTFSNVFQGSGSFSGDLIQATGATLNPGGSNAAGILNLSGNLTLNGGTLRFDLSNSGSGVNDQINDAGTLTLNGTNDVNLTALSGGFDTNNPYTLITASTLVGDQTFFRPAGGLGQSRYTFTFDTSTQNSVRLFVGGVGPANLTWVGDGSANLWNLKGAANWNNGAAAQFFSLDSVTFTDAGSATPAVNLVGTLNPGAITLANSTENYTFNGTGGLTGAPLTKTGAGAVTFTNVGDNSFGGLVSISDGPVTLGNTGQDAFVNGLTINSGSLTFAGGSSANFTAGTSVVIGNTASLVLANNNANVFNAVPVELDGSLTFNESVDNTMDAALSGSGSLIKGGNNTLTLAGANGGLATTIQINSGTLKAGSVSALGQTAPNVANNATLDINGQNLAALPVTASGPGVGGVGAVISTGGPLLSGGAGIGLGAIVLTGDTSLGGSGPFNSDPIKNVGVWGINGGSLSTSNHPYKLTKVGLNEIIFTSATIDPGLGDIDIQQGLLLFENSTDTLGDPSHSLTVRAGATLSFYNTTTLWNKNFIFFGDGVTPSLLNYSNANTLIGPVTLNGNCVVSGIDLSRGTPISITLAGPVGGTGSLSKQGIDTLILAATNNYSGTTTVSAGVLLVTGVNNTTNSMTVSGGTLAGNGIIRGPVTVSATGTLSPGDTNTTALETLSISNTLTLAGTCVLDLDKTAGVLTSDLVSNLTTLTIGGVLQVNLTGDPLVAGDAFKVFSFSTANGAFTSITPSAPADGLAWDTSTLKTDGKLRVKIGSPAQPLISSAVLRGNSLVFDVTGGVAGATNLVLTTTNLTTPASLWTPVATNIFDGSGNSHVTNNVNPGDPQRYFLIKLP